MRLPSSRFHSETTRYSTWTLPRNRNDVLALWRSSVPPVKLSRHPEAVRSLISRHQFSFESPREPAGVFSGLADFSSGFSTTSVLYSVGIQQKKHVFRLENIEFPVSFLTTSCVSPWLLLFPSTINLFFETFLKCVCRLSCTQTVCVSPDSMLPLGTSLRGAHCMHTLDPQLLALFRPRSAFFEGKKDIGWTFSF